MSFFDVKRCQLLGGLRRFALVLAAASMCPMHVFAQPQPVVVRVRPVSTVFFDTNGDSNESHVKTLRIADVASCVGGAIGLRQRIANLDLEDYDADTSLQIFTLRQLELRLRIAGIDARHFQLEGPVSTQVNWMSAREWLRDVERELGGQIATRMGKEPHRTTVKILRPEPLLKAAEQMGALDFKLLPMLENGLGLGRHRLQVTYESTGNARSLYLEVRVGTVMRVAYASQTIPAGIQLTANMFSVVDKAIDSAQPVAMPSQLAGRRTSRSIAANSLILESHLATGRTSRQMHAIRTNDWVDVIVPLGSSEVRLKDAKALSSGAVGETITVLNTRSNRRFTATVLRENLATVRLSTETTRGITSR